MGTNIIEKSKIKPEEAEKIILAGRFDGTDYMYVETAGREVRIVENTEKNDTTVIKILTTNGIRKKNPIA